MKDSPMFCPACGTRTRVVKTSNNSGQVVRLRFCEECGFNYRTKELFTRAEDAAPGPRSERPRPGR